MEMEQEYKREDGEEDEMMSWELIPRHVLEKCIRPLLPIHSLIRFGRVCREWNELLHSWEFIRPFLLKERSVELLKFCLLKRFVPLPKGVETLEKEDGSVLHTVSAQKWPFLLAVAAPVQVMEKSSHWKIRIWELVMDDTSERWKKVTENTRLYVSWCKVVGDEFFFYHSDFDPLLPKVTSFRIDSYRHIWYRRKGPPF